MNPSFKSAILLIGLMAPLHTYAQHHRHHGVPVVVNGGTVVVTETASPVYITVTGSAGATGADTNPFPLLSSSSTPIGITSSTPVETASPSETLTPSETPAASEIPTPTETPSSSETLVTSSTPIESSTPLSQSPTPTQAPVIFAADNGGSGGSGSLTIAITNSYGAPLSLALGSNFGGPQPDGNPQPTSFASAVSYTFPSGWAGRIAVGKSMDGSNSLIEASFGNGPTAVDVSYVDAYSVPITCSVGGNAVTGCNIELFNQGISCDTPSDNNNVCINSSARMNDGPPPAFFAACEGAAYTFPNDNTATDGGVEGLEISCCVGTSCPSPPQQKSSKRALARRDGVSSHLHSHQHRHVQRRSLRSHVHQLVQEAKLRK